MELKTGILLHGGTYRILEVLGQGSFGVTYLAEHIALGKKVAIKEFYMKELNSRQSDGSLTGMTEGGLAQKYCEKFKREAISLSKLEHPNIVRVTDSFNDLGTYFYVMDFIEGMDLNHYVKEHFVDQNEAVEIIRSIAAPLTYLHDQKHMLHLDLKPSNVMRRTSDGHIFLIDFGLSKHFDENGKPEESTNIGLGTAGYAPIEQANVHAGDFRPTLDVYALGATFYKLLTGETPPSAATLVSDSELLGEQLRAKGISENLIKVVEDAMTPNVRKRTQTVSDFISALGENQPQFSAVNEEETNISQTNNDDTAITIHIGNGAQNAQEDTTINFANDESTRIGTGSYRQPTPPVPPTPPIGTTGFPDSINGMEQSPKSPSKHSLFSFKGRIGRLPFALTTIGGIILLCLPAIIAVATGHDLDLLGENSVWLVLHLLIEILYVYICLAMGAKRCHDMGNTGWFQLIPFYGIWMLFVPGTKDGLEPNDYGKMADGVSTSSVKLLAGIVLAAEIIMIAIGTTMQDNGKLYQNAEDMIEGHIIENGVIVPADSVGALPIIQKLAKSNYGPAMWMLARYYENGSAGITADAEEAKRLLNDALPHLLKEVEEGDKYAQCALALMYQNGDAVTVDESKAFSLMLKSAEQGYGDALGNLASCYYLGIGCQANYAKAIEYMKKATAIDKTQGEMLAGMYLTGDLSDSTSVTSTATAADTTKAVTILKELADMQSKSCCATLGKVYYEQEHYDLALQYLTKVENEDNDNTLYCLTMMYNCGWGTSKNTDKAITYCERLVNLDNRSKESVFVLAICYETKEDYANAFKFMNESANDGFADAQYRLAIYYQNGLGVKANESLAYQWYQRAIANGYQEN